MSGFETVIRDPSIEHIFTLSDIHADIHSLIIALRDCAKIIRKKEGFEDTIESLEPLLNIDLNTDTPYPDDLNYEWCIEHTYLVIIGDTLDGFRDGAGLQYKNAYELEHEYNQIEIKILKFINALNKQAIRQSSRIIKLLGNHEVINILPEASVTANNYIFPYQNTHLNYYNGMDRQSIFKFGNEGFRLLFEDGIGCLIQINNNVFVHGNLKHSKNIREWGNINSILNNTTLANQPMFERQLRYLNISVGDKSILWDTSNDERSIDYRNNPATGASNNDFCAAVKNQLDTLASGENLRLFVGHCIQAYLTWFDRYNRTFTIIEDGGNVEIITPPARTYKAIVDTNFLFGISMECENSANNDHLIYRVDVGASRAFDGGMHLSNLTDRNSEKKILLSRSPQVLEIYNNDRDIRIIRSKIGNTRRNQPRYNYERHANSKDDLNLSDPYYREKYLKYKNKYLKLKQINYKN